MANAVRNLASQVDAGELDADAVPRESKPAVTPPAPDGNPEGEATNKNPEAAEGDTKPKTGAEKQPAPAAKPDAPGEPPKGEKPGEKDSKYTRAQKSEERLTKSWTELNAEKEQLKRDREELEKLRSQAPGAPNTQPTKTPAAGPDGMVRDEHGRSASDYAAAAEDWEREGDAESLRLAKIARTRAGELQQAEQSAKVTAQREGHKKQWTSVVEKTMSEPGNEDLANPESELAKSVLKALEEVPAFTIVPDGFAQAVKYARNGSAAARVANLEKQVTGLQKQLDEANQKLQPHGSGVTTPPAGAVPVAQLPLEKRGNQLRKLAREIDASGAGIS